MESPTGNVAAFMGAFICLASLSMAKEAPPKQSRVPKRIQSVVVEQVVPAYRSNKMLDVLKALSPLLARMKDEQIPAFDTLLQDNQLPQIQQLVTDGRLMLLRVGKTRGLPNPRGAELRLLLTELEARVTPVVNKARTHSLMGPELPRPANWKEYDELFWSAHVLGNELINTRQIAAYGAAVSAATSKRQDLEGLPVFSELLTTVDETGMELSQRRVEMHFHRLVLAERILQETHDLEQRIFAAYSVDFDGNVLQEFLKENKADEEGSRPKLLRKQLAVAGIDVRVATLIDSGKESAGDMLAKSRLFFEGLHFWMRGRYGRGTDQGGLMKSRYAIQSPQAQVALLMPMEPPEPNDPLAGKEYQTPQVDRRHHYIWATEQPRLQPTTTYFH